MFIIQAKWGLTCIELWLYQVQWENNLNTRFAWINETETDIFTYPGGCSYCGSHIFAHMNAPRRNVCGRTRGDEHSLVVSWSGAGEVACSYSGGIFAIKLNPLAIFPLSAQAKYQGMLWCCFAPLVELIRCSQRTALSSHCSAHKTASVALQEKQWAKITQRLAILYKGPHFRNLHLKSCESADNVS